MCIYVCTCTHICACTRACVGIRSFAAVGALLLMAAHCFLSPCLWLSLALSVPACLWAFPLFFFSVHTAAKFMPLDRSLSQGINQAGCSLSELQCQDAAALRFKESQYCHKHSFTVYFTAEEDLLWCFIISAAQSCQSCGHIAALIMFDKQNLVFHKAQVNCCQGGKSIYTLIRCSFMR